MKGCFYFIICAISLLTCSDDDTKGIQIEDCETGFHFAKMLRNDECWVAENISFGLFSGTPETNYNVLFEREKDGFLEVLYFVIPENNVLGEKTTFYPLLPPEETDRPVRSRPYFTINEAGITLADYGIREDYDPEQNYFIVDAVKPDGREITGRFKCTLLIGQDVSRMDIPKMIEIVDGEFKLQRTD